MPMLICRCIKDVSYEDDRLRLLLTFSSFSQCAQSSKEERCEKFCSLSRSSIIQSVCVFVRTILSRPITRPKPYSDSTHQLQSGILWSLAQLNRGIPEHKIRIRNVILVHKAQIWAAKIIEPNYFETSFTPACRMVTRSGVTFLLVTIFSVSDEINFKENVRKCPENFECVSSTTCEHYNQRLAEYRQTNNTEIITELRATICNKRNKAVCCRFCGKPQKIPESVKVFLCM